MNIRTLHVALSAPDDDTHQVVVVGGIDLVIPLEQDLDDDPLQDDEVRLRSAASGVELHLLASDPDVTPDPDSSLLLYHFREVPPGLYDVEVKCGEHWTTILRGLLVTPSGAQTHSKTLGDRVEAAPERTAPVIDLGEPAEEENKAPPFYEDAGDNSE